MIDVSIRRLIRRAGLDLGWRRTVLADLLRRHEVDVVLDVGANEGQFGRRLRAWGYRGRIISFEPLDGAYAVLARHAARDGNWEINQVALGAEDGTGELNVSDATVFSSLMRARPELEATFPEAAARSTQAVQVRSLDSWLGEHGEVGSRPFLKVDVQGYEHNVLRGAATTLPRLTGVQVELTLSRLYAGESTAGELLIELERRGLVMALLDPVAYDQRTGAMLAVDAIFFAGPETRPPAMQPS